MATLAPTRETPRSAERVFIYFWTVSALAMIFAGFFPSWFGRAFVADPRSLPLTPLVWVHGLAYTAWVLLFLVQLTLMGTGKKSWHMKLGRSALLFAPLLVLIGIPTALAGAVRGSGPPDIPVEQFLLLPLVSAIAAGWLIWEGYRHRFTAAVHKRMMLFVIAVMIGPGSGRLWDFFGTFIVPMLMVAAIWVFDLATNRKLDRRVVYGGTIAIAAYAIPLFFGGTQLWLSVASAMIEGWRNLFA